MTNNCRYDVDNILNWKLMYFYLLCLIFIFEQEYLHLNCHILVLVSPNVCQHLWECICYHSAALLRNSTVSHTDAACERVYPLPPDPQPTQAEARGVFSTFLELHQWHRHEHGVFACWIQPQPSRLSSCITYNCLAKYIKIFIHIKTFNERDTFAIHSAHCG